MASFRLSMLLILLSTIYISTAEWQGDLSAYQTASFTNPPSPVQYRISRLNHFAIDQYVYVGAVNWIYRLDRNFNLVQDVTTATTDRPDRDSNYNKLLIIDSQSGGIITCGSFSGTCQLRRLGDITDIVFESGDGVASHGDTTTVGIIAPHHLQGSRLYIGATPYGTLEYEIIISRRQLDISYGDYLGVISDRAISCLITCDFHIKFVTIFQFSNVQSSHGFTYFIQIQRETFSSFTSKISRVCQDHTNIDSYTEITIECRGSDGSVYSLVQAAHLGPAGHDLAASLGLNADDQLLYAVFAKNQGAAGSSDVPMNESALCVYKMTDILDAFKEAVRGCIQEGGTYSASYLERSFCAGLPAISPDNFLCNPVADGVTQLYRYAKGITPLPSTAVLEVTGVLMSSIITNIEVNHTIGLIGTSSGQLLKVHIESSTSGRIYERVDIDTSPVLRDIKLDDTARHLFLLTEQKLVKLRVENCSQYTSCESCIGTNAGQDGDPYCGWCTLERKCSRYSDCPNPDVSTRWLAYNEAQCLQITNVSPYNSLPLTVIQQQITLTVQEIPELFTSQSYECWFGSYISPASKTGDSLQCTSPPSGAIPPIQQGDDAVTVLLSMYSSESSVKFVDTSFHFYECSTHTSCVSCVGSRWACDWCVFENRCTHQSSTCSGQNEIIITGENNPATWMSKGPGYCPQLEGQSREIFFPVGLLRSLTVQTTNLPHPLQISSYVCSLEIEGNLKSVPAVRNGDNITCSEDMYVYSSTVPVLDAKLRVTWTDTSGSVHTLDDVYGYTVTLYDCNIRGPDCSRCVTARPELGCVWCDNICRLDEACSSMMRVTLTNGLKCPDPVLTDVYPTSGPVEGNTVIEIHGTDIGRRFQDVASVMVGGQPCDLTGLEREYEIGGSVSCRTSFHVEGTAQIVVTVTGADNTSLHYSSNFVEFTYKDPRITDFTPRTGPEAGGTLVTVTGTALQTGRVVEAYFGDTPCLSLNVTGDSFLQCVTSTSSANTEYTLVCVFDGAHRTSSSRFIFRPNPVIQDVSPPSSFEAGGRQLTVTGISFDLIQTPKIVAHCDVDGSLVSVQEQCMKDSGGSIMTCASPDVRTLPCDAGHVILGFIMDGVIPLLNWSEQHGHKFTYVQDPVYFPFDSEGYKVDGSRLGIKGERINLAMSVREINVSVGNADCDVVFIDARQLYCDLPSTRPDGLDGNGRPDPRLTPTAVVRHGNLVFDLGKVIYPGWSASRIVTVALPSVVVPLVAVLVAISCFMYCRHRRRLRSHDARLLKRVREIHHEISENVKRRQSERSKRRHQSKLYAKPIVLGNNVSIVPDDIHINFSQLELGNSLGQGAFGRVLQATLHSTAGQGDKTVAVKTVQDTSDASNIVKFLQEGLIMSSFDHPNVLGLLGLTFDMDDNPLVVLPFMANGDLKSFLIKKKQAVPVPVLMKFAFHVASGMAYLAQHKFVHRDLAARNCMVDKDLFVKIADFGLSREMQDSAYYTSGDAQAKLPIKWMAPESMERRVYNSRTDVWSYGVLLWEIFTQGKRPYPGIANRDVYDYIQRGQRLKSPNQCPHEIYWIMQRCWQINPKARCTFRQVVNELQDLMAGEHDYLDVKGAVAEDESAASAGPQDGTPEATDEGYLIPMVTITESGLDGPCDNASDVDTNADPDSYVTTDRDRDEYANQSVIK